MPAEYVDLPIYREVLASALGFTPSDLNANRAGRLSASQRASLLRSDIVRLGGVALCLLAAVGSVGLAFAIGTGDPLFATLLSLAAVLIFAAGALAVSSFALWRDLTAGAVSRLEGQVEPTVRQFEATKSTPLRPASTYEGYFWVVGDQRFAVSGTAFGALTPARHCLYFLPRTRRVVAAEPMSSVAAWR